MQTFCASAFVSQNFWQGLCACWSLPIVQFEHHQQIKIRIYVDYLYMLSVITHYMAFMQKYVLSVLACLIGKCDHTDAADGQCAATETIFQLFLHIVQTLPINQNSYNRYPCYVGLMWTTKSTTGELIQQNIRLNGFPTHNIRRHLLFDKRH